MKFVAGAFLLLAAKGRAEMHEHGVRGGSRELSDEDGPIIIHGEYMLYPGHGLRSIMHVDLPGKKAFLNFDHGGGAPGSLEGGIFLDWSRDVPIGYSVTPYEEGEERTCVQLSLDADSLLDFETSFAVENLKSSEGKILIEHGDTHLAFHIENIELDDGSFVYPAIEYDQCKSLTQLEAERRRTPENRELASHNDINRFYGGWPWYLGQISFQGKVFHQTEAEHNAMMEDCRNEGTNECKPEYTVFGNWLGQYGKHCGDGWGGGSAPVSGVDYCCQLHDQNKWGVSSDESVKTVQNVCGLYACLQCSTQYGFGGFGGADYTAGVAIHGLASAAAVAAGCYEGGWWTGFTCN